MSVCIWSFGSLTSFKATDQNRIVKEDRGIETQVGVRVAAMERGVRTLSGAEPLSRVTGRSHNDVLSILRSIQAARRHGGAFAYTNGATNFSHVQRPDTLESVSTLGSPAPWPA